MISGLFYFNSCAVSNSDPLLSPTPKLKYLPMHQFCKDQSINKFSNFSTVQPPMLYVNQAHKPLECIYT